MVLLSRVVQCAVRTSTGTGRVLRRDVHNEKTLTMGGGDGGGGTECRVNVGTEGRTQAGSFERRDQRNSAGRS